MSDFNVIDSFLNTFITYIDSGFGLLNGDVASLASILIGIDVTLAALFWLLDGEENIFARLIKKVLYIGAFAFIINNFSALSTIVFNSFSQLGLHAGHSTMTATDLLRPGKLAGTGFEAAWPLLQEAGKLVGFTTIIDHAVTILVLVGAWFIVVLAFFILAVQLFITILEFKLTALAGFVLVPFALWNRTSFLAERVLGNVVSSGVKVMVLAVIIGIGSSFFGTFTAGLPGDPTLANAMTLVLAALALFGLGIFGPAIASGLVSGAPQLGAGAVLGTGAALVGGAALTGAAGLGAMRALGGGGLAAIRAGTSLASGTATAYGLGSAASGQTGMAGVGAGLAGVAKAGAGAAYQAARGAASRVTGDLGASATAGARSAFRATGGSTTSSSSPGGAGPADGNGGSGGGTSATPPAWARRLRAAQQRHAHVQAVHHAIREGDRPMHGAAPDLGQE
jgi:type IV secretion system protein TrbL